MSEVFFSIRPEFVEKIVSREKNHEYRKYQPRQEVDRIWIYSTSPKSSLNYIAEVGKPVVYPDKISVPGYGNEDFNAGLKVSKYAFPINHLYELEEAIALVRLRIDFNFSPPQGYAYTSAYPKLVQYVQNQRLRQIF